MSKGQTTLQSKSNNNCRLWTILAKSLGISKQSKETQIFSSLLYFLTFSSAASKDLGYCLWFTQKYTFQLPLF